MKNKLNKDKLDHQTIVPNAIQICQLKRIKIMILFTVIVTLVPILFINKEQLLKVLLTNKGIHTQTLLEENKQLRITKIELPLISITPQMMANLSLKSKLSKWEVSIKDIN